MRKTRNPFCRSTSSCKRDLFIIHINIAQLFRSSYDLLAVAGIFFQFLYDPFHQIRIIE